MWFDWLVRRCDMGALAVVSPLQQPSSLDQQGSEIINPLSASDATTLVNKGKAERRAPHPHVFPPSSFPCPNVLPNELVSSLKCVAWGHCFDNTPCKELGYHAGPGGLKALSISLLGGNPNSEGESWVSDQQRAKNYLQIVQELKQSRFNHGLETSMEPEQFSPRYKELKAGFWKRLAADNMDSSHKEKLPCDSSSLSKAHPSKARVEEFANDIRSNPTTGCKKVALPKSQGSQVGRGGPLDRGVNGSITSVEVQVLVIGKRNGNTLGETKCSKPKISDHTQQDTSHVQKGACNSCYMDDAHHQELANTPTRDGLFQSSSTVTHVERDQADSVCRIGVSSDGESLDGDIVAIHTRCAENHQQQQQQEQRLLDGSVCSFSIGSGIGRGRITEDGSPMSTSLNRHACEDSKNSAGNLEGTRKEEDGTFWSSSNWCVVDSYMTGHGKETTWTVRGFEEDDGIFEENLPDCKDWSPLKVLINEKNQSRYISELLINNIPVKGPDVEARHGPPPKWTQQALHERVAKNLREQEEELVRSTKNGLEILKHAHKQAEEGSGRSKPEDGGREEAECQDVVLDELIPIDDMFHYRKGRKLLKEVVLTKIYEKVGGRNIEESRDMNEVQSTCISPNWKNVRRSSTACVGPSSTHRSHQDTELPNFVSLRDIRGRKRGWIKRKGKTQATNVSYCVSMIGDTVKTLRRTREDAAALALKLVELQAGEVKDIKATTSEMRIHVELLRSEVQELQTRQEFNVLVSFPWQQFLKNIVIGISLVSGTLGLHHAIKSLFRLLFGRTGLVQIATSRKEKTVVAMVILCSGSYVAKDMWKIFSHVQSMRITHEALYQEKLRHILSRLSSMSTLIDRHLHQGGAEETGEFVLNCEK